MDIYPISFVKNCASIVTVSEQPKARPGSTAAHKSYCLPDRINTLIYQQRSKEIANHSLNGRNGSAKGLILPLKHEILGTER
jgi:hypothetical protein